MKLTIIFSLITFAAQAQHFQDTWAPTPDKMKHFTVGALTAALPAFAMCHYNQTELNYKRGLAWGLAVGGGVNLAKEIYDYKTNTGQASVADFTYGLAGAAISSVAYMGLMTLINNSYKRKQNDLERAKQITSLVK
jgi:uncharacterized protein YfiM (DUF2279 family)